MFWKIYTWFVSLFLLAAYSYMINEGLSLADTVDIPLSLVALIGLYSYAYKKMMITATFWKIWLFVIVVWDITYNILLEGFSELQDMPMIAIVIIVLISFAMFVPEYIALYRLGFKSTAIMNRAGLEEE